MKNAYTILIVDDIFINRMLIKEIAKSISSRLFEAENGKEAIDILLQEEIDLVLMDIEMPVMNGIETTRYIRTKMPPGKRSVPIIALTAHNPDIFAADFEHVGFDKLLTKPYNISKVLRLIEEVFSKG